MIATGYIYNLFHDEGRQEILDWVKKILSEQEKLIGVNAVAGRGVSGIVAATLVAFHLGLKLIVVRKEEEVSHASYQVEGLADNLNYIIIDDLVSSGNTVRKIVKGIQNYAHKYNIDNIKCSGILLYQSWSCNVDKIQAYGIRDK